MLANPNPELSRSAVHTPRSHVRSDRSPFVEGKKNNDFISPTYTSNIFANSKTNNNNEVQNLGNSQNFIYAEKDEELTRARLEQELMQV